MRATSSCRASSCFPAAGRSRPTRRMPVATAARSAGRDAADAALPQGERRCGRARSRWRRSARPSRKPACCSARSARGRRRCRTAPGRPSRGTRCCPTSRNIHFIGRAITPPGRPRRFDARFFTTDASAIAHRIEGVTGPDAELVELVWMPLDRGQAARHAGGHRRDAGGARRAASPTASATTCRCRSIG